MQTRALETLIRIDNVQSFTRAAQLQNMTLSALSQQMRALEEELGAALFDRAFRPPRLTPLGRQVARQAASVLQEQAKLEALCGADITPRGQFRFGFIQSASVRILQGFMKHLQNTAPYMQMGLATGLSETLSAQVAGGQLDGAVITRTADIEPGLIAQTIVTEPMALGVPNAHKDLSQDRLIQTLPFIHFRPSTGIGKLIAAAIKDAPHQPADVMILDGIEACVECVRMGLGYTILPVADLERYRDNRMVIRTDMQPPLTRDLALVTRDDPVSDTWRHFVFRALEAAAQLSRV